MIQNVLRTLGGVENYGMLSLFIFCSIFCLVLLWTFLQRSSHLDAMARIPLENEPNELTSSTDRSTTHE